MKWAAHVSVGNETLVAIDECLAAVRTSDPATLVFAFVTPGHDPRVIASALADAFPHAERIGCTGGGVIGGEREVEGKRAVALAVARCPDVVARTWRVGAGEPPEAAVARIDLAADEDPAFLVLAEPFTCDVAGLASALDARFPRAVKVGGIASGSNSPGQHALFADGEVLPGGAVVLSLTGDVAVEAVVAQGARPIGRPMQVTQAERNVVRKLDGQGALVMLESCLAGLEKTDLDRFRRGPLLGIAADGRPGDWLVRNLVGVDRAMGAFTVGWKVPEGALVQFHVRDPASAAHDLREQLRRRRGPQPAGALLFSCLGRGMGFFGEPNHDTRLLREGVGPVPVAGFFCNGEIGPVRGHTAVHGYTSAIALLSARGWD